MKEKILLLELRNCVGYGFMSYIEFDADSNVMDFLRNFCMWGGSTKTLENFHMYELSEETMKFMQSDVFKSFLAKNNVRLITETDSEFSDMQNLIFKH